MLGGECSSVVELPDPGVEMCQRMVHVGLDRPLVGVLRQQLRAPIDANLRRRRTTDEGAGEGSETVEFLVDIAGPSRQGQGVFDGLLLPAGLAGPLPGDVPAQSPGPSHAPVIPGRLEDAHRPRRIAGGLFDVL